jgi:hypothetical protein
VRYFFGLIALGAVLFFGACAQKPGGLPHAVVNMRDGSSVAGTVLSSSATEIQISGDDKVTRTIPMTQVRSVDYGDVAATAPPTNAPPTGTAPPTAAETPDNSEHVHPAETAVTTKTYLLPVGTQIPVRNEETIDSGKAAEGQLFVADVTRDIRDGAGDVVIPRGANARIIIRSASKGGKIKGASDLVMDLDSVTVDGRRYRLSTVDLAKKGHDGVGVNKRTGEFAGGGAAIGAIIGAIAGGGKGAAIGAGSGAGAGAVTQIVTKGTIKVPVESILTFQLDRPLRVTAE